MPEPIVVQVAGWKELQQKLLLLGRSLDKYAQQGLVQAGKELLQTEGLQKYPPSSEANEPPTPYYIRGRGMQYKSHNNGKSEKLGTQWHVDKVTAGAYIYNRTSYAPAVHGEGQARFHELRGWRKLKEVVEERMDKIKATLTAWVDKALKDARLK